MCYIDRSDVTCDHRNTKTVYDTGFPIGEKCLNCGQFLDNDADPPETEETEE